MSLLDITIPVPWNSLFWTSALLGLLFGFGFGAAKFGFGMVVVSQLVERMNV